MSEQLVPASPSLTPQGHAPVESITTAGALRDAIERWRRRPWVAFDTEFVRERTYYANLGLVQVYDGEAVGLIDPLALPDLSPLAELFADPSTVKVAHSASEDLEVLERRVGVLPEPLFDTQIAAVLTGMSPPPGYQRLIAETLGVELVKGETRTDWVRRPLTAAQLAYAAEDVSYLLPAFLKLRERLLELDRWDWAVEDSATLVEAARSEESPDDALRRFRSAARLTPSQQLLVRELATWREAEARRRNLPRQFVVRDELLLDLAVKQPKSVADLAKLRGYDARQAERYAESWLSLLGAARPKPAAPLVAADLTHAEKRRLEALREVVQKEADRLGVRADVLANRRPLERLARGDGGAVGTSRAAEVFSGWRAKVVAPLLDAILNPPPRPTL